MFDAEVVDIGEENSIHFVKIEALDQNLKDEIDAQLVSISNGTQPLPLDIVKSKLTTYFAGKSNNQKMGSVAEFMVHLYLRSVGFQQECLFRNQEENSLKKGFDGYYSLEGEEWIMESKSGRISTQNNSHPTKIITAYNDLKDKIEGRTTNDPWHNAYSHANAVGAGDNILANLTALTIQFTRGQFPPMSGLNISPASTIYHEDTWLEVNLNHDPALVGDKIASMEFRKIQAVCIDKKAVEQVLHQLTH
jgi:hypothetical protein